MRHGPAGALPDHAEVPQIGVGALHVGRGRLLEPLRPNLLAEQRLADTVQLSLLVTAAARAATCDDLYSKC